MVQNSSPDPQSSPASDYSIAQYLQSGLEKIDQGVTIFDADLRLVFVNKSFFALFDMPEEVLAPGESFENVIRYNAERGEYGEGDVEALVADRVSRAQRFEAHALERERPNGMVLQISGWPIAGGGFATIYTDVTEQRRREAQLEREVLERTEELRRNEARLRLIANEVPAGIAYMDREQVFQFANTRFAESYGLDAETIIGKPCSAVLSPALVALSQPYFDRAMQGEAIAFDHEAELADGRRLDVRTYLRPERESLGTPRGFYILSIYIGREKRAEATLFQAKKMEALDQLSSGIAHDFNNLLTVIIGNLAPLERRLDDEETRETLLAPALRAARRGAELTRRLLATARRQPLEPSATDIGDTVQALASLIRSSMAEGVSLDLDIGSGDLISFVDRALLENAVLNLAINARDAVGACGSIAFTVARRDFPAVEAQALDIKPGGYVEIRCADDGVGIDRDVIERVFEPFFSTKASSGGSGLGLAIVYAFVRRSGGGIQVQSEPDKGSVVSLFLPVMDAAAQAALEGLSDSDGAARPAPSFDGLLALLVDDEAEVRTVMRRELVELGFSVVEASDGREALDLATSLPELRLVLSDIAMPGDMSGVELAKELAEARPELAVVLMTGHGLESAGFGSGAGLGASGPRILRKPIEPVDLAQALGQALLRAATEAGAGSR